MSLSPQATKWHLCTISFQDNDGEPEAPVWSSPEEADEQVLVTDGLQMHNLHKDIFYIADPSIAFIGVPYHVATFSLFEYQAMAIAAVYSGKSTLPSQPEMRNEYNKKVKEKGVGRVFHSLKGEDVNYANELISWINPGIVASGGKAVEGHLEEWKAQYEALRQAVTALGPRAKRP
ncbi:hypothetical protein BP6252_10442 [Coleophoma cylindrospora]|uniref:Uncharacterized protein n=1 Tax=Coleophoma cylindrospora TaxID=1849047 RepID=A0A3D8QSW3_9HELO|nr:hypothetical protein BP6252_10442 [Coleophoma cylindrospora]